MRTYQAKLRRQGARPGKGLGPFEPANFTQSWYHVDAQDQVLGRVATRIAMVLMGKHKPTYTRHIDTGDFVVVTNADKVAVTREKNQKKIYYRHTGYLGGLKAASFDTMKAKHPTKMIELAVRCMLPKSALGRQMLKKLKIFAGPEHPHQAQQPQAVPDWVR